MVQAQRTCLKGVSRADVRFGSLADVPWCQQNVRFVPIADMPVVRCAARWDLFRIGGVKTVDEPASLKFVDER